MLKDSDGKGTCIYDIFEQVPVSQSPLQFSDSDFPPNPKQVSNLLSNKSSYILAVRGGFHLAVLSMSSGRVLHKEVNQY